MPLQKISENELEIIDNKALLLTLRNPQRVTTVIPKSKELNNNQVVVKWGLDEAQVLRNLKIKGVPSPIWDSTTGRVSTNPLNTKKQQPLSSPLTNVRSV